MKIDEKTSPYQGDVLGRCPVMKKKAPLPSLTWKQLNQLLTKMGVLPRTADPTGEVPGRVMR
jgi:hypothetical protein